MKILDYMSSYGFTDWFANPPVSRPGAAADLTDLYGSAPVLLDISVAYDYFFYAYLGGADEGAVSMRETIGGVQCRPPWDLVVCAQDTHPTACAFHTHELTDEHRDKFDFPNEAKWVSLVEVFSLSEGRAYRTENGAAIAFSDLGHFLSFKPVRVQTATERTDEQCWDSIATYVLTALQAFAFAHCKGATCNEVELDPRALRKAAKRKKPLIRHRKLRISVVEQALRQAGRTGAVPGSPKAVHLCRGSFATYSADAPLFGKYVGQVWRREHVKGRDRKHIVTKDYAV